MHVRRSPTHLPRHVCSQAVITDIGVATLLDTVQSSSSPPTRPGAAATSSTMYTAPEVLRGGPRTCQADVYSLGMLLYELYTGTMPYQGMAPGAITAQVLAGERPLLRDSQAPDWDTRGATYQVASGSRLAGVVRSCWEGRPQARPAVCEVVAVLQSLLECAAEADAPAVAVPTVPTVPAGPAAGQQRSSRRAAKQGSSESDAVVVWFS
jgi:serine/threonine protein kinase